MMRAFLCCILLCCSATAWAQGTPNILFLSIDDLNDRVEPLSGAPVAITPAFNSLEASSFNFSNAHVQGPDCASSRASMLSGLLPATPRLFNNLHDPFRDYSPNVVTLPEHFQNNGYLVFGVGKVFHAETCPSETWWDWCTGFAQSPAPATLPANGIAGLGKMDWAAMPNDPSEFHDYKVADWIIARLQQSWSQPFLLMAGFVEPHFPWFAPDEYFDMYDPATLALPQHIATDLDDLPDRALELVSTDLHDILLAEDAWEEAIQAYLACISFTDSQVGRVLAALDASPYANNTIVVVTSDHGFHIGQKSHWRKFGLWEEATRVPLFLSVPGMAAAEITRPVGVIDLYPTLSALAGIPVPGHVEGRDLSPLLQNPTLAWPYPALTMYQKLYTNTWYVSARSDDWRYIQYNDDTGMIDGEELYDHQADPFEWVNLAGDPQHATTQTELMNYIAGVTVSSMDLLDPLGGETWAVGSVYTITWSTNLSGDVSLELFNNGGLAAVISPATPAQGTVDWKVPEFLLEGEYWVKVSGVDYPQVADVSGVLQILRPNSAAPAPQGDGYRLGLAHPNPFNSTTTFSLAVDREQQVDVAVYDVGGRRVAQLHSGRLGAGPAHHFSLRGSHLASGLYVIRASGEFFSAQRVVTLKK